MNRVSSGLEPLIRQLYDVKTGLRSDVLTTRPHWHVFEKRFYLDVFWWHGENERNPIFVVFLQNQTFLEKIPVPPIA